MVVQRGTWSETVTPRRELTQALDDLALGGRLQRSIASKALSSKR
jgi:hypothetical protein